MISNGMRNAGGTSRCEIIEPATEATSIIPRNPNHTAGKTRLWKKVMREDMRRTDSSMCRTPSRPHASLETRMLPSLADLVHGASRLSNPLDGPVLCGGVAVRWPTSSLDR